STSGSGTLDTAEITIPRLLKQFNISIKAANIGKWHLHNPAPAWNLLNPLTLGYDHYEGPFIGQLPSFTNWTKYTNGISSTITTYATTENVNNAVAWLKTSVGNPFFLWLAFNAPHSPYHLPPANLHSYTGLTGTTQHINQNPKLYFKASMQALDTEIGRLMDSLQAMNVWDSTDIIFIGDNGNAEQTAQITTLNQAKGTVYQYGVHVPFIVSGPSVVHGGRQSDALINTTDIFATVLELFGNSNWSAQIPITKPVDSKSFLSILKDQATGIRDWSFCEIFKTTTDSADGKGIRNSDYKLIRFDHGVSEFYDLTNDPGESTNLLTTNLNSQQLSNYNYLCSELTNLVGSGAYCQVGVGLQHQMPTSVSVYPNPFTHHIYGLDNESVVLYNQVGQVVYDGNNLQQADFSNVASGLYFLQVKQQVLKLVKE
ncbi:MAG TPA: sulfatase-like hydrolase/transferase, partial [Chitinophagaceae bacterium]|nr:sulfatase-like hydrolase/transferase [Chitinophagaceae bacterium]